MDCTRCGACCVAPDIAALDKPLGVRCAHLGPDGLCACYEARPRVCRDYQPDDFCRLVEAPTLEERVERYLALFGLQREAAGVRARAATSMGAARARPVAA